MIFSSFNLHLVQYTQIYIRKYTENCPTNVLKIAQKEE